MTTFKTNGNAGYRLRHVADRMTMTNRTKIHRILSGIRKPIGGEGGYWGGGWRAESLKCG
jgi:hypothetical protein